jgi:competence protein ComEC
MAEASTPDTDRRPRATKYHPLVIVLAAACAGIIADRHLGLPLGVSVSVAAVLWLGWLLAWRKGWTRTSSSVLLGAVAFGGAGWHHCQYCLFPDNDLASFARPNGEPACVEATVLQAPERIPAPKPDPMRAIPQYDRTQVELTVTGIRDGAEWQSASGRTRLTVDGHLLGVHTGDRLQIFAQLSTLEPPENPGEFDFAAHQQTERRRCRLWADYPDCITRLAAGRWWNMGRRLEQFRSHADRRLAEHLSPNCYGLATTLLLGLREELGSEGNQAFLETGTIHILSISGMHVGIIAGSVLWLLRLLAVPRRRTLVVVAVLTTLYTLLTGAEPPAVRSLIIVLVMCLSTGLSRPSLPFNSLAAAALVVLALNPGHLFNVGVQLSFLAVAGLIMYRPLGHRDGQESDRLQQLIDESQGWLSWALKAFWRGVWQMTLVSAAIWLLTLPLVMARFHLFQLAALVLNTLLWLPVPVALISGAGAIAFSGWLPPVAWIFGRFCDGSIWTLDWLVETARAVPASHIWVPGPADWWLAGFYGGLGILCAFPRLRPPRRWCVAILASWSAIGFGVHFLHSHRDGLEATFLSMEHGCAVVLQLPNGATMLYDAGQFSSPHSGARTIAGCLWSKGIAHLDAVILSHADADHYNALPELLRQFSIGVVYVSPVMFENQENPALTALGNAIRQARTPLREISAGDRLRGGPDCRIEVLHPPRRGVLGGDNANSIVLAIEYQHRRLLLPGDLTSPGLEDVMAEEPWDCDVLLAPHHGSRSSDPPGLAAWCQPDWVVISGGHRWDARETMNQYRRAGSRILHTGETGAVRFRIRGGLLTVEPFRQPVGDNSLAASCGRRAVRVDSYVPSPMEFAQSAIPLARIRSGQTALAMGIMDCREGSRPAR